MTLTLKSFFRKIGLKFNSKSELFDLIEFEYVSLFHLTTRLHNPDGLSIFNLVDVLSDDTEVKKILGGFGYNI